MDNLVARYDFESWREVPFDYGEEWEKAGFAGDGGEHYAPLVSALGVSGHRSFSFWHMGGMRVFIADAGNARIVSVKLGYHAEEKISLKSVPDVAVGK